MANATQSTAAAVNIRDIANGNVLGIPSYPLIVDLAGVTVQPVSIHATPQTPASPTAATVGVTSAQAVAANANRTGLVLINTSANIISLGLGVAAVLNSGITLNANGGTWEMDGNTFITGAVFAIASAGSSNLAVQEFS